MDMAGRSTTPLLQSDSDKDFLVLQRSDRDRDRIRNTEINLLSYDACFLTKKVKPYIGKRIACSTRGDKTRHPPAGDRN